MNNEVVEVMCNCTDCECKTRQECYDNDHCDKCCQIEKDQDDNIVKCPICNSDIDRIESCSGVDTTYEYDSSTKTWKESDTDYHGETIVTYQCTECWWNS